MVIPIFDHTHQPIPAFLNLLEHAKNQFISSLHSWDTVNFRVPWPDRPHPFLTMPTQNFFDHILIYVNSYHQHAKNQAVSLIFLEIWLIKNSCKPKFSQKWDLSRNTAENISFHYRTNSVQINCKIQKIFNKFKKPFLAPFLPIFPILSVNKIFWKIWLCHAQLHMDF